MSEGFKGKHLVERRTFMVFECTFHRETVTVTVLSMKPAFVTIPISLSGGMLVWFG